MKELLLRLVGAKSEKFEMSSHKYVSYLALMLPLLTFLLVACGGGDSGTSYP
jgi:hypothetical protein